MDQINLEYALWGIAASVVIGVGGIAVMLRWLYRLLRTGEQIKDQVLGDPDSGVVSLREFKQFVTTELSYNSGKSLKDQVRKISQQVGADKADV